MLVAITALGWLLGARLHDRAVAFGAAAFVIAACPAAWAAFRAIERGRRCAPDLARRLRAALE